MHGNGSIGVRSERGVGSTFALFIGVRLSPGPAIERPLSVIGRPGIKRVNSIEVRFKMAQHSVLLVEDNLINVSHKMSERDD